MGVALVGLEDYGLNTEDLAELSHREIRFTIQLRGPDLEPLVPLPPEERDSAVRAHLQASLASLERRYSFDRIEPRSTERPFTIDATASVSTFLRLSRARLVSLLMVDAIEGVRKPEIPPPASLWAVHGKVAIQIEGQTRGYQVVEDRIVVVRASSREEAEKRLEREWESYRQPFLNDKGELVRWNLEEVVDVYCLGDDELDPNGTEVWSSLSRRRMRPEYEWHPRGDGDGKSR